MVPPSTAGAPEELNPQADELPQWGARILWNGDRPIPTLEPHDPMRHLFIDKPGTIYDATADREHVERWLNCFKPEGRKLFLRVLTPPSTLISSGTRGTGCRPCC